MENLMNFKRLIILVLLISTGVVDAQTDWVLEYLEERT